MTHLQAGGRRINCMTMSSTAALVTIVVEPLNPPRPTPIRLHAAREHSSGMRGRKMSTCIRLVRERARITTHPPN